MAKDIYSLELHEGTQIFNNGMGRAIECFRVPGGWVYNFLTKEGNSSTFVPYTDDGMNVKRKIS